LKLKQLMIGIVTLSVGCVSVLSAQPTLVTETVSMGEAKSVSVELRPTYRVDLWKVTDTSTEYTDTVMRTDLNARWVPVEKWEVLLEVPHVSDKLKTEVGTASSDEKDSGIGQVILGGKWAFCPKGLFAGTLRVELPTADQDKLLGEGLNIGLGLAGEKALGPVMMYANAGYLVKQEYKTTFDTPGAAKTKEDPGDIVQLNAALSYPRWGLDWVGEVNANIVGREKDDATGSMKEVDGSAGTAVDLVLGVHKMFNESWSVKGGVAWGVGDEKIRTVDMLRGAGDYKVILAGDYRFNY